MTVDSEEGCHLKTWECSSERTAGEKEGTDVSLSRKQTCESCTWSEENAQGCGWRIRKETDQTEPGEYDWGHRTCRELRQPSVNTLVYSCLQDSALLTR